MKFKGDVDIDMANRDMLLKHIRYTNAAMYQVQPVRKHNTGIHVTDVPYNPMHDMASIDYNEAEKRGYFKLDVLNVHLYSYVKSMKHLRDLMKSPDWSLLNNREIFEKLIHVNNHWNVLQRMPEPIDSIPRLAMFLAIIRPAKRHLIGKTWSEVSKTIWDRTDDYSFKRSHSIAYAHLVVVNLNLISEGVL